MNPQPHRTLLRLATLLIVSLIAASCSLPEPILPRNVLFKPFTNSSPLVSPDGRHVVYAALDSKGVRNLHLRTIGVPGDSVLTNLDDNVGYFFWARNNEMVAYSQTGKGGSVYYVTDINTHKTWPMISPDAGISGDVMIEIAGVSMTRPDEIALSINDRDPSVLDLHLLNLRTGEIKLIAEGKQNLLRWYVGPSLNLEGYLISEPDGGQSFWKYRNGTFKREITWTLLDDSSWPLDFAPDGKSCIMMDSRGESTVGVVRYDLTSKKITPIARNADYDIRRVLINPMEMTVDAVNIDGDTSEWIPVNDETASHLDYLQSQLGHKQLIIINRSFDRSVWTVGKASDDAPPVYYLYFANEQRLEKLFSASKELEKKPFSKMRAITFAARDGMEIHGYLTTPRKGSGPWPTVVLVHGGPWMRDVWGFNPEVQWLANRGYAVLQVNFRGSSGYNKQYLNSGNRQWGKLLETDIEDGVAWAIKNGFTSKDAVAIYGGSYGGYAAVEGTMASPPVFAAAVAVCPFLNLVDYLSTIPPTWEAYRTNLDTRIGRVPRYESGLHEGEVKDSTDWNDTDRKDIKLLKDASPYFNTEKVSAPLLIAQGKRDMLARPGVTEEFVEMLKSSGKSVEIVWYDKSGHKLLTNDAIDFYFRAEVFFAKYLGGRVEK